MSGVRRAAWGSAAVAALVFLPSLWNGFAYDDVAVLVNNESLHGLDDLSAVLTDPYWGDDGEALGLWRPLTSFSLAALWELAGGAPWAFHLANVVLHAVVTGLVTLLAGLLLGTRTAWIAGLLFAVHPVHVEAVANGVGIAELLSAVFSLGACLVLLRREPRAPLDGRAYATIMALFALALLAKENAAVLPGLLVVLEWWRERTGLDELGDYVRRRLPLLGLMAVVMAGILALRLHILGSVMSTGAPLGAAWLAEAPRIWTMAAVWIDYVRLLVWPVYLSPDYSPPLIPLRHGWDLPSLAGLGTALVLLGSAWYASRRRSAPDRTGRGVGDAWPLGLLWFVVGMLPVSNLIFLGGILLAERTFYLPSVGPILAVACAAAVLLERARTPVLAVTAMAVALLAVRSLTYTPVWASQTSLFNYMLDEVPESARTRWVRADLLLDAERDDEALSAYREAVSFLGDSYSFLTKSAALLVDAGHQPQAAALYRRAWHADANRVTAPRRLAVLAFAERDWPRAAEWAHRALLIDEELVELWHMRAGALGEMGRWPEAADARAELLLRGERDAWQQWVWLAEARLRAGDRAAALAALDTAVSRGAPEAQRVRMRALADSLGDGR